MPILMFDGYMISTGSIRDKLTGTHKPRIEISWNERGGRHGMRSFTLEQVCFTPEEARLIAFHEAKAWAGRWLSPAKSSSRDMPVPVLDRPILQRENQPAKV